MKKQIPKVSTEKMLHPIRAPRLEGVVKNAMMNPVRKKKQNKRPEEKKKS